MPIPYNPNVIAGVQGRFGHGNAEDVEIAQARQLSTYVKGPLSESSLPGKDNYEKALFIVKNTPNWWTLERKVMLMAGLAKDEKTFFENITPERKELIGKCADASIELVYGKTAMDVYRAVVEFVWEALQNDPHGFDELVERRMARTKRRGSFCAISKLDLDGKFVPASYTKEVTDEDRSNPHRGNLKAVTKGGTPTHPDGLPKNFTYDPLARDLEVDEAWKEAARCFSAELVSKIGAGIYNDLIDPDNPANKGLSDDIANDRELSSTMKIPKLQTIVPEHPTEDAPEEEKEEYVKRMYWECWE